MAILLSSSLSGTYQGACLAREDAGGSGIYLIDSKSATIGIQVLVDYAVTLRDRGCSGREIAVVGIDNTVFAEYVVPSLSSIGYDKEAYGRQLIRMFLEEKNGEAPRLETVHTFFIERESIFPLKHGEQTENAP